MNRESLSVAAVDESELDFDSEQESSENLEGSEAKALRGELKAALARVSNPDEPVYQRAYRADDVRKAIVASGEDIDDYFSSDSPEKRQQALDYFALKCFQQDGSVNFDAVASFMVRQPNAAKELSGMPLFDDGETTLGDALAILSEANDDATSLSGYDLKQYMPEIMTQLDSKDYAIIQACLVGENSEKAQLGALEAIEALLISKLGNGEPVTETETTALMMMDDARAEDMHYPEEIRAELHNIAVKSNYFDLMTKRYDEFSRDLAAKARDSELSEDDRGKLSDKLSRCYLSRLSEYRKKRELGEAAEFPTDLAKTMLSSFVGGKIGFGSKVLNYDIPEMRAVVSNMYDEGELSRSDTIAAERKFLAVDARNGNDPTVAISTMMKLRDYTGILMQQEGLPEEYYQAAANGMAEAVRNFDANNPENQQQIAEMAEYFKENAFRVGSSKTSPVVLSALEASRQGIIASGDYAYMCKRIDLFGDNAALSLFSTMESVSAETSDEEIEQIEESLKNLAAAFWQRDYLSDEVKDKATELFFTSGCMDIALNNDAVRKRTAFLENLAMAAQNLDNENGIYSRDEIDNALVKLAKSQRLQSNGADFNEKYQNQIRPLLIKEGLVEALADNHTRFTTEEFTQAFEAYKARWAQLDDEEKRAQSETVGELYRVICLREKNNNRDNSDIVQLRMEIGRLVSEIGEYKTIASHPEDFTEKDIENLIARLQSENTSEEDRAEASVLMARLFINYTDRQQSRYGRKVPEGAYSAETLELARQAVISEKRYAFMMKNYQMFPEFIEKVENSSLDAGTLNALSQITDEEVMTHLNSEQRRAVRLVQMSDNSERISRLLARATAGEDGVEHALYETLFAEGSESRELIASIMASPSGDLRRFSPVIIEQAIAAVDNDPRGATTLEKYVRDERDFFMSPIPHYLKLLKSAIYWDISLDGDMRRSGTAVLRTIENYAEARKVLGGDLLRSEIRSNSTSLKQFLERAAKDELGDDEEPYLAQVLGDASVIYGVEISSPIDLLRRMSAFVKERDAINRASVEEDPENPGHYRLARPFKGSDIKKGISQRYLDINFEDGFNAPEMLGADAFNDATHFDTDTAVSDDVILEREANGEVVSLDDQLRYSTADSYGTTKILMRNDDRFQRTSHNAQGVYDALRYELYDRASSEFRGIRTGFGALDIDGFSVVGPDSSDIPRLKFEIAKSGCYIPIINRRNGEVIFAPEEFDEMRARFSGLRRYGNSDYESGFETDLDTYRFGERLAVPASVTEGLNTESFEELMMGFDAKRDETVSMQNAIVMNLLELVRNGDYPESVKQHFEMIGSSLEEQYSANASIFSTGSTGRLANVPHDGDYDFMLLLDKQDYDVAAKALAEAMRGAYGGELVDKEWETGLRSGNLTVDGQALDLDFSIMQKTDQLATSTDSMLAERYRVMEAQNPEAYRQVIANVIIAKALMKDAGCYKKMGSNGAIPGQGGIGGIGVENWILQSGGSLYDAMQSFIRASDEAMAGARSEGEAFKLFKIKYPIFDMGQNFQSKRYRNQDYPYDDLTEGDKTSGGRFEVGGWRKMLEVCRATVAKYEAENQ